LWLSAIEIVRSCFNVSSIILFRQSAEVNSQFVRVPLDLQRSARPRVAVLPDQLDAGNRLVEILPTPTSCLLHVFDLHDEHGDRTIKAHYEQPIIDCSNPPHWRIEERRHTTATLLSAAIIFALACVVLAMVLCAVRLLTVRRRRTACWRSTRYGCARCCSR